MQPDAALDYMQPQPGRRLSNPGVPQDAGASDNAHVNGAGNSLLQVNGEDASPPPVRPASIVSAGDQMIIHQSQPNWTLSPANASGNDETQAVNSGEDSIGDGVSSVLGAVRLPGEDKPDLQIGDSTPSPSEKDGMDQMPPAPDPRPPRPAPYPPKRILPPEAPPPQAPSNPQSQPQAQISPSPRRSNLLEPEYQQVPAGSDAATTANVNQYNQAVKQYYEEKAKRMSTPSGRLLQQYLENQGKPIKIVLIRPGDTSHTSVGPDGGIIYVRMGASYDVQQHEFDHAVTGRNFVPPAWNVPAGVKPGTQAFDAYRQQYDANVKAARIKAANTVIPVGDPRDLPDDAPENEAMRAQNIILYEYLHTHDRFLQNATPKTFPHERYWTKHPNNAQPMTPGSETGTYFDVPQK